MKDCALNRQIWHHGFASPKNDEPEEIAYNNLEITQRD